MYTTFSPINKIKIINNLEIIQSDWNNAPYETILFKKITSLHWNTNEKKQARKQSPELVPRLETSIQAIRSSKIVKYSFRDFVFTVNALRKKEKIRKSTLYYIINELDRFRIGSKLSVLQTESKLITQSLHQNKSLVSIKEEVN